MSGDDCDVGWQSGADGVGDEYPAEVLRSESQRLAGGVGQPHEGDGLLEDLADGLGAEGAGLTTAVVLEEDGRGCIPLPLFAVVAGDQRDQAGLGVTDSADDRGQNATKKAPAKKPRRSA
ncbi:hypothetical protein ABZT43_46810 [Streptomyces sp. NPDC005349]|uniref:hypothetical protein n=1 Tax=Streptomyces sp. NPDC005349 TaxID=3157037 RepID=UPI0033B9B4DF